jgi:hypothetical protein
MNKTLTEQLKEAMGKPDAKKQADQLKQFLAKTGHKKGSKEEEKEIEKWLDSKDFDDKDADRIMKMLEANLNEGMKVIKKQQSKFDGLSDFEGKFLNLVNGVFGTVKFDDGNKTGLIPTKSLGEIPFGFNGQSDGVYVEFAKGKKALSKNDTALGKVVGKLMEIDKLGDWE